jgi:predicted peptidase
MGELSTTLDSLERSSLPGMLKNQDDIPFLVVSPLGKGEEYEFWPQEDLVEELFILLGEIQATVTVDPDRIYLTGESAGGNGTWAIGLQYPEYFAALVPIAGYYGYPFEVPENICDLKDIPIWAFHGENDEVIPLDAEESIINALEACGGDVQLTVFPDIGHDLDAQKIYNSELFTWLLDQTLK